MCELKRDTIVHASTLWATGVVDVLVVGVDVAAFGRGAAKNIVTAGLGVEARSAAAGTPNDQAKRAQQKAH